MPKNVSNGQIIQGTERDQVVALLAQGFTIDNVAKRLRRSHSTVAAVRDAEFEKIEARKPLLAAQAERGALLAGEKIVEAVANGTIKGSALVPAYGVFIDKTLALRGDPGLIVAHQHQHIHAHISESSYQDLLANLPSKAKHLTQANE